MVVYEGKAVFEGIAIGKLYVYTKQEQTVKRIKVDDCEAEKKRYEKARETAMEQLQGLYDKALKEVGESGAEIFEAHQFLVEDGDYIDSVENIIDTEGVNAEYAVATTGDNFFKMFSEMEDEYFRGRATDIKDITENCFRGTGHRCSGRSCSFRDGADGQGFNSFLCYRAWFRKFTHLDSCKNHEYSGINRLPGSAYRRSERMHGRSGRL